MVCFTEIIRPVDGDGVVHSFQERVPRRGLNRLY
jgi:hypothetical protein